MKKYLIIILIFILFSSNALAMCEDFCKLNISEVQALCNKNIELPQGYCNVSLSLRTDKLEYNYGDKITISNDINYKNYTIAYWIEDLEGNKLKNITFTTNSNNKQYSPKFDINSTIIIKNNLTKIDCININNQTSNNLTIKVQGLEPKEPTLDLILSNEEINISEKLNYSVNIYTGDNENLQLNVKIENLTESKIYQITAKFNLTSIQDNIQIPANCNLTTKTYYLLVTATNLSIKKPIKIINNCNRLTEINQSVEVNASKNVINLTQNQITGNAVYQSKNLFAKEIAKYFFMVVLALVAIWLIIKSKETEKTLKKQWYLQ
jgi:hypothetical protein